MYKFRTMVKNAELLKKELKNEMDGPMFKMKGPQSYANRKGLEKVESG